LRGMSASVPNFSFQRPRGHQRAIAGIHSWVSSLARKTQFNRQQTRCTQVLVYMYTRFV
jgi:hypothetical protein